MKKIGILTALAAEREQLERALGEAIFEETIGHFKVKKYIYAGNELYFAESGMGEIYASACTEMLIIKYGIELMFNYGLAGNVYGNKIGDVVLIDSVVHYDFDTRYLDGNPVGKYDDFDSAHLSTDLKMREYVLSLFPDIKRGICASADKFVIDKAIKERLYNDFKANVCEMEAAGILITSLSNNIPAILIKVVSDSDDATNEYWEFKALVQKSKADFLDILQKVLDNLNRF